MLADPLPVALSAANPDASVPYEFRGEIARGGMGSILEAADCKLGRTVAVKIMLSEMRADADQKQRFINEAAVLAQLAHPNIVPVYDIGRDAEGQPFYTMKLVHGRTLQAILNGVREGDADTVKLFTLAHLLTIFRKVCDALAFAHSRQIIHRDLKPENIMVGEFGEVLVMDWGLAKRLNDEIRMPNAETGATVSALPIASQVLDANDQETIASSSSETMRRDALRRFAAGSDTGMTLEGDVMGTPQYMSPEQAQGRIAEMDARSDIFSLGGILYAILTLHPPVEGKTLEEMLYKVVSGSITAPTAFGAVEGKPGIQGEVLDTKKIRPLPHCPGGRVPTALSAVTMKALSLKREARYQDVTSLSADVEAYQNGFATRAENAGAWRQFALFVRRHKAASIGVAAVLLVGGVFGTKAIVEGRRAERGEALAKGEAKRANQALDALKQSAPAMLALAESEAVAQHFQSALDKTEATLRLDPDLLPAYWRRAWGLIALGKFSDAVTALHAASERDPANAWQFSSIVPQLDRITAFPREADRYSPDLLAPVFEFLESHGARGEAGALIEHLRLSNAQRFAIAKDRLKALGGAEAALKLLPSGLIELSYIAAKLNSLEQVRGIPFDNLYAIQSDIESLEPLRGLHLTKLTLGGNKIRDLTPLRGMILVELDLRDNYGLDDLSLLTGMPLRKLIIGGAIGVVDLSPLQGMPLEHLDIIRTGVTDLRPLIGMPLRFFAISGTKMSDLRPFIGMPLETLQLNSSGLLTDLSPLTGLPLKELSIRDCRSLKDLTPLLRISTLERLETDAPPEVLVPLRQHPKLAHIDYQRKGYRPVAEVWAELDAKKAEGKK